MRPGYKNIALPKKYVPIDERDEHYENTETYVPSLERAVVKKGDSDK